MKLYTWYYPNLDQVGDSAHVDLQLAKLAGLRATGVYLMLPEGPSLQAPEGPRQLIARLQEAGLQVEVGFAPFSDPPDPTPEMLRRRYAYYDDGILRYRGLCPAWPENRLLAVYRARQLCETFEATALHLDYLRYYFANSQAFGEDLEWEDGRKWIDTYHRCACPLCQTERLELLGREPTAYDRQHPAYIYNRLKSRDRHVRGVLTALRDFCRERGMALSVATRVQYFNRALIEGQDWARWCERGLMSTMVPMNYSTSLATVQKRYEENARVLKNSNTEVLEGLARRSSAGENTPEALAAQVRLVLQLGAPGVSIFHLDVLTEQDVALLGQVVAESPS